MDKELNEVLEKKFLCPSKFAQDIEKIVSQSDDINYIEAIIVYCEENKIELETVPKLLSKPLKEKLKFNAMELNFLKRSSRAKLPLRAVNLIYMKTWVNWMLFTKSWCGLMMNHLISKPTLKTTELLFN